MDAYSTEPEEQPTGQMSFLEHLDELRKRLVNSVVFVVVAFMACWFISQDIYNFLSVPIRRALSEASRREVPVEGLTGDEKVLPLTDLKEGDSGRYIFDQSTKIGTSVVAPGTSVLAVVAPSTKTVSRSLYERADLHKRRDNPERGETARYARAWHCQPAR